MAEKLKVLSERLAFSSCLFCVCLCVVLCFFCCCCCCCVFLNSVVQTKLDFSWGKHADVAQIDEKIKGKKNQKKVFLCFLFSSFSSFFSWMLFWFLCLRQVCIRVFERALAFCFSVVLFYFIFLLVLLLKKKKLFLTVFQL